MARIRESVFQSLRQSNFSGRWASIGGAESLSARVLDNGVVDSLLHLAVHIQLLSHLEHLVSWLGFALPACLEEVVIGGVAVPGGVLLAKDRLLVKSHSLLVAFGQVASIGVEVDMSSWSRRARRGACVDQVHQMSIILVHSSLQERENMFHQLQSIN